MQHPADCFCALRLRLRGWPLAVWNGVAEASEVTRPWRTLNISQSSSKGLKNGNEWRGSVLTLRWNSARRTLLIFPALAKPESL